METREKSAVFEEIAQKLIDTAPELAYIKNSQVRIVYLVSNQAKKTGAKVVHGECEKIPAKYCWAIPAPQNLRIYKTHKLRIKR